MVVARRPGNPGLAWPVGGLPPGLLPALRDARPPLFPVVKVVPPPLDRPALADPNTPLLPLLALRPPDLPALVQKPGGPKPEEPLGDWMTRSPLLPAPGESVSRPPGEIDRPIALLPPSLPPPEGEVVVKAPLALPEPAPPAKTREREADPEPLLPDVVLGAPALPPLPFKGPLLAAPAPVDEPGLKEPVGPTLAERALQPPRLPPLPEAGARVPSPGKS
jgi:hypothetical protein